MAIVANGDVEKLKGVDCSAGLIKDTEKSDQIDLSIFSSIYKIKKGHKFSSEEAAKKRARPNSGNHKMTNGASSHSPSSSSSASPQTQSNGSPDSANSSSANANQPQPVDSSSIKTPSSPANVQSRSQEHSNASINCSAKSNAPSIAVAPRTPPPTSNQIDSALRLMSCKQTNQPPSNLSAIQNGLTASPPLSTANKFSIANILNEHCEATPLDSYRRHNPQSAIDLPSNASSLLVPNMMLNQNDLTALSSFNLIAWQASYAAQHAQAGTLPPLAT